MMKKFGLLILLLFWLIIIPGCIANDGQVTSTNSVKSRDELLPSEWVFLADASSNAGRPQRFNFEIVGNITLVQNRDGVMYALNTEDGTIQWRQEGTCQGRLAGTEFVTSQDVVFIQSFDQVLALDLVSGREIWTTSIHASRLTLNPENQEIVYVETENKPYCLYALNALTGKEVWKYCTEVRNMHTWQPQVSNGTIVFQTKYNNLHALDSVTGREKWYHSAGYYLLFPPARVWTADNQEKWVYQKKNKLMSPLLAQNSTIFFHCADGFMYALGIQTGEERWKFQAEEREMLGNPFPVLSHGMILYQANNNQIIAVNATSGSPVWRLDMKNGDEIMNKYAISDDTMYFGNIMNEYLYAVDLISGQKKWISEVDSWTSAGAPALSRGKVFIGGRASGYMSAFDERDGTLQWQYYSEGVTSTPVIFEDRIFFSNHSGYLFSLNLSARGIV